MPSYIPEHVYSFTGWDERNQPTYGLVPWPERLKPRQPDAVSSGVELTKKGEAYVQAALAEAGGVFFLTLDRRDRASIATSIERLINMLDAMEPDPDLEPYLAGCHHNDQIIDLEGDESFYGDCDREPSLGAPERHPCLERRYSRETKADRGEHTQLHWATGDSSGEDCEHDDEREHECEDEGAQCDDEGADQGDREPDFGWTNHIDQTLANRIEEGVNPAWAVDGGEPDLGFVGHGTGWRKGEDVQDREACQLGDDEREHDHAEHGIADADAMHSEDCCFAGWSGDGSGHRIGEQLLEQAHRPDNGDIVREIVDQRDAVRTAKLAMRIEQRRRGWNSLGVGNLPPEAFEGMIPEISLHRPTKH